MTSRIRTVEFLPEIFQTKTNKEFFAATLDQLVNPPLTTRFQGYIGNKIGYGIDATDSYVPESTKIRSDYQLDPGVVFTKPDSSVAHDFISYPGILDALKLENGIINDHSRLFESQIYSWDSFSDLDKLVNYNQYYWLPLGPPAVTISASVVYKTNDYVVTDLPNGYDIRELGAAAGSVNPTLTLLRGGTYQFIVNQPTSFWIQGEPGTSGFSSAQPNQWVRDVFGVTNNGATQGVVTFTVPAANAQDEYLFPGNHTVDVVTTLPFDQVNGKLLSEIIAAGGLDGMTSIEGLSLMFYNTGISNEIGYISVFYDESAYGVNLSTPAETVIAGSTTTTNVVLTTGTTTGWCVGKGIIFTSDIGGLVANQPYYVESIVNSTEFTVSENPGGTALGLSVDAGPVTVITNDGLYEEGYYTTVADNFYTVQFIGDPADPTIRLIPHSAIPVEEKITPIYGETWINRGFYKNSINVIALIPYLSAPLDTLYYQDGTASNKVGVIKIIESNITNNLDIETDILGKKTYTAPNGVVFTNGLKVRFDGDVIPENYLSGEYYVEGVGTAIELISVQSLISPEIFTTGEYVPYDTTPYDMNNYDSDLFIPSEPDYFTISRNSISKNAWSRSNRWFHVDVIEQTAIYNNDSTINSLATAKNKAKRPIIEFYPNLQLFNSGIRGKDPIDFIDTRATDAFSNIVGLERYYPDVEVYTGNTATIAGVTGTSTTITIPTTDISGTFQVGQYISDYIKVLPNNTQITDINIVGTTTELTVTWSASTTIAPVTNASVIATRIDTNNYSLFVGARIIFANDADPQVRNKVYVVNFTKLTPSTEPVITLTLAPDSLCEPGDQSVVLRGYDNQGSTFYYDGVEWKLSQKKLTVNQPPLFDVYDNNGISFGDSSVYPGTSFTGCKLFAYGIGSGTADPIIGLPIRYSSIENVGDISFDVSLNSDTFEYALDAEPTIQMVNTGYVHDYKIDGTYTRKLGWETAVAPSVQYQAFVFDFKVGDPGTFICDIPASQPTSDEHWASVQVYVENSCQCASQYDYSIVGNTTVIQLNDPSRITQDTAIQVLVYSDSVSSTAHFTVPVNLSNNPLNDDLTVLGVGDIRQQYRDIYVNAPGMLGPTFGSNNYRDLGNLVKYGSKIIKNSAPLVLPGTLLRKSSKNVLNALSFNSNEYVKFKNLLIDTIDKTTLEQTFTPSDVLDKAMDVITQSKGDHQAFFWSDMLPTKAAFRTRTYDVSSENVTNVYSLSTVYDFSTANYNGVLVYLSRTVNGSRIQKQLIVGQDYTVSDTSPSITITASLLDGDTLTVKEYNQTYGSYVPNTPTKLGLYPASKPAVVYDDSYETPTYFIRGHDGSYNKLYGDYDPVNEILIDFRDQGLLEFEKRIYNNLKLSSSIPIKEYEVVPGFFRDTDYTYDEYKTMYTILFLNWIGQTRLDYKTQYYNVANEFTYNYSGSTNRIDDGIISQGNWRGVYLYFYDTSTPDKTPWEMLGFTDKPDWWETRYGPAPYTSNNSILWTDVENGVIWNGGNPTTVEKLKRPGLSSIIPVDPAGNLLPPIGLVINDYSTTTFNRSWKPGDFGPVELSYRKSSSYPFDLMKLYSLMKPAKFYNLGVDLDNYRYNEEFNQYLVNDRSYLKINEIDIYGNGTAKTSYLNWIVDYEKQLGNDSTSDMTELLDNVDVRLVYRLAGYSDKSLLKFYVEKGTSNSTNASLLIPDESFSVLLYDNQPFDKIVFSSVVVQTTSTGYAIYGNSQSTAYFRTLKPINGSTFTSIEVEKLKVRVPNNYTSTEVVVPYGTIYKSEQELATFLSNYSAYLKASGVKFDTLVDGIEINWNRMISEFLYWAQTGWQTGSIISLNPAAEVLKINKENAIVQPLRIQQNNFVLNQDLYLIQSKDLSVTREDTEFSVAALNVGDSISYGQFNLGNFEHGIVFDNTTLFNDTIYNLTTGLRQNRIFVQGTKTAEWNGTINAYGFILNQDNIKEWNHGVKYTKGSIVLYKNKYWTATRVIEPANTFDETIWNEINYDDVQIGLLPNPSTRSYESALYYDVNHANLEKDADLLSFSLIGFRPRDYLSLADLTDITQVNVYKNMIRSKGTRNSVEVFKETSLPQGEINYDVYENWAIKMHDFGGTPANNFIDVRLNEPLLTYNPSIISLVNGQSVPEAQQEVPIYTLFNYAEPITSVNVLPTKSSDNSIFDDAGYVRFDDVKMASYFYSGLSTAVDKSREEVDITDFYVGDYVWLANYFEVWDVLSWKPVGVITAIRSNLNGTATVTFSEPHGLSSLDSLSIVNYANNIDGYYTVIASVSLTEVLITLNGTNDINSTGEGIGLTFNSHRVDKPSSIGASVDLLENEFTSNTVWVDESPSGTWAVYRKNINYSYDNALTKSQSNAFGTAVAYNAEIGTLISDAVNGEVYRYNRTNGTDVLVETITNGSSFGSSIEIANRTVVIPEPTGASVVRVYEYNKTLLVDELTPCTNITAPLGVTDWGTGIALSDDSMWLYISDIENNTVHAYRKQHIVLPATALVVGETYSITTVGDSDFTLVGAPDNVVGVSFVATGTTVGTGTATQISYKKVAEIDATSMGLISSDLFGKMISTTQSGDLVFISAPMKDYSGNVENWGTTYAYSRSVQSFAATYTGPGQSFNLSWTPTQPPIRTGSSVSSNYITANDIMTGFSVNDPVMFYGTNFGDTGIEPYTIYYIEDISGSTFTIKSSRQDALPITLVDDVGLSFNIVVQVDLLSVAVNGTLIDDANFGIIGTQLIYTAELTIGDIIEISGNKFTLVQTFTSDTTNQVGVQFGTAIDNTVTGNEVLIGAPFEIYGNNYEGVVYRYTNAGSKFGVISGTAQCNITVPRTVLINGYAVTLPPGDAEIAANTINNANITNVMAAASSGYIVIQLIDSELAIPNKKLNVYSNDVDALAELGITVYINTQKITCPHVNGRTQFGTTVKFNESGSVVISAPVGTRVEGTLFDFTDDSDMSNDTVFDNNATRFVDYATNAGAVYMFDYLENYNEHTNNVGQFVYAQSVNSTEREYGEEPRYGTALAFTNDRVIIGTPGFLPESVDGQVTIYENSLGVKNWSVYRQPGPIVDVSAIKNAQLYSAETNETLTNLDYIDPLNGKLLGVVRENLDYITSIDPARYNSEENIDIQSGQLWGSDQVGKIWFSTKNVRFLDYHQDDITYNSEYWGRLFPGSDVAIYSWIESRVRPNEYSGPGTPYDSTKFVSSVKLDATNVLVAVYYFWVRNTNTIFKQQGKSLSDRILESYIRNPVTTGIPFIAPVRTDSIALYNTSTLLNGNDTVLHVGYATSTSASALSHSEYSLIRSGFPEDFLPGLPKSGIGESPYGLYDRLLDSLAGVDEDGGTVPDPYLPKAYQTGIKVRPRQSLFVDRFGALQNYISYTNDILIQYPIRELRPELSLLYTSDEFYDTSNYWEFVNWWSTGYNGSTKSSMQVQFIADLTTLDVEAGTIVTVENNGTGSFEIFRKDDSGWTRIGLENGTIQIKSSVWNYSDTNIGYGASFYDSTPYDEYPSEETRYILRAINEQLFIDELLVYRNKGLVLLFEYIQSESRESQNYLPWLNKTSLVDVSHKIRSLEPIQVYQTDNQEFLEGYLSEVKPYRVVIKDFVFTYSGNDTYQGTISDFDLPSQYSNELQQFISPKLAYSETDRRGYYTDDDDIWQTEPYYQWFTNKGVVLSGQPDYEITTLNSYMTVISTSMFVDNAQGFPINGVVRIGDEYIGYSSVDRAINQISGLTRGLYNTLVEEHFPGETIVIDLPEVILLNGGSGYEEPPKVTAYIDETIYPAPVREAKLEAVMSIDSVLSIKVIDPGLGYMVQPEIRIDPALTIMFSNTNINSTLHTINVFAPNLATGDLVKFNIGTASIVGVANLADNQWYYINVLETSPASTIALYNNYSDALNDRNRIEIADIGTNPQFSLSVGAKAAAIVTASPIRETNTTIRFDRTSYTSQVTDWKPGTYYGSYFAGDYLNTMRVSSSSLRLYSQYPNIDNITASGQGVVFEINDVSNERVLEWSSLARVVASTTTGTNAITLTPLDDGSGNPNASGSTIGFYYNMPIKFVGSAIGGLIPDYTYYVKDILSETSFTVSSIEDGAVVPLSTQVVGVQGLSCYTGEFLDSAILTINYPGILETTHTESVTNKITVPTTLVGTGGTSGFYKGLPIFFTGSVFGGIVENEIYYVTTVVDNETFTMSEVVAPKETTLYSTTTGTNVLVVESTIGFNVNDPVIFTNSVVAGVEGAAFGNIITGVVYYIREVVDGTTMKISAVVNGPVFDPGTVAAAGNTYSTVTNQVDTVQLTTANGSMLLNVSLPVSPGQINGQKFTLYNNSIQYPNITGTVGNLITQSCVATIATVDRIALSGTTDNMYVNMPIEFIGSPGGSGISDTTTYYIIEYSGQPDDFNPGQTIPNIQFFVTATSSTGNTLLCDSVDSIFVDMPVVFSGSGIGGIVITTEYYVETIDSINSFITLKDADGNQIVVSTDNGLMIGTGSPYIKVSTSKGGAAEVLTTAVSDFTMTQEIITPAELSISYVLGGYKALITNPGEGYAVTNTISIAGTTIGGTDPENNITVFVNTVDQDGGITDTIPNGVAPTVGQDYYLRVISDNQVKVYSDAQLTIPVSGIDFEYPGFVSTTVTTLTTGTNLITVDDVSGYEVNDKVVFTGLVSDPIEAATPYYIISIVSNDIQVSTEPGGSAVVISSTVATSFTMTKARAYAFLPEPFYFTQSIVKFNNRVYVCVISNNDDEFVFGKWQLLDSSDRRLNAMDRVIGYYRPTANMPGVDLTQLFEGVTYPNTTYLGNPFAPADQYSLDMDLQAQEFYPTGVDIIGVVWDGTNFLAVAEYDSKPYTLGSTDDGITWSLVNLTNYGNGLTDIIYDNGIYILTSSNPVTPIFRSEDGIEWTTTGFMTEGNQPIVAANLSMNAVSAATIGYVAVGSGIITSPDTYTWTTRLTFNNPQLTNILNGVSSYASGVIAVGKGQIYDYSTGITEVVDSNLIYQSIDGITWNEITTLSPYGLNGVAVNDSGTQLVSVGEQGVIYYSSNGVDWYGVNEVLVTGYNDVTDTISVTNTAGFAVNDIVRFSDAFSSISTGIDYYIVAKPSSTQLQVSTTIGGSPVDLDDSTPLVFRTRMRIQNNEFNTLNDIAYGNGIFVTVGENGVIRTSTDDGITWGTRTSGTTSSLNAISYKDSNTFIAVGEDIILISTDSGVTWTNNSTITISPPDLEIDGGDFEQGYSPEELVAGNISDTLAVQVHTRPGTNWPIVEYGDSGYEVASIELQPYDATQVEYSFNGVLTYPSGIYVAVIDYNTGRSRTIYEGIDYTINWVDKTVTLVNPLLYMPTDSLRIDVYGIGNGNQLVKSNTDESSFLTNDGTQFQEIPLNCNYSAPMYQGSGVIRPGTYATTTIATATDGVTNRIYCNDVSIFLLNGPVKFVGAVFGGLDDTTTYFVKSISYPTNSITVSTTNVGGVAGPIFDVTTDTGYMGVNVNSGAGTVWTEPVVFCNGARLVFGVSAWIIATDGTTNEVTATSTAGIVVGDPITFCACVPTDDFGIQALVRYYVREINGNKIVLSTLPDLSDTLPLTNGTGTSMFVTRDYAIVQAENGISAKIVFAVKPDNTSYDLNQDFISYAVFGESYPEQYNYTVPESEVFDGDGSITDFALVNYVGGSNPENAIVEIDGLRQSPSSYTIDASLNTITFLVAPGSPGSNSVVTVTTFNDTNRQYLNTQIIGIGNSGVTPILNVYNAITPPMASTYATSSNAGTDAITVVTTAGMDPNVFSPVIFSGSFDANIIDGKVYFLDTIVDATSFTIKDEDDNPVSLSGGSGFMTVVVGGNPAVRIETNGDHGFNENDLIRIDGLVGSEQLNNNTYYAKVITRTMFDLYELPFDPSLGAINYPISSVSTHISGGYVWKSGLFFLAEEEASNTTAGTNAITVGSTAGLVPGTPIYFSDTGNQTGDALMGGIVQGTEYYVKEIISPTEFTISDVRYGDEVSLTTDTGPINVMQWKQEHVDRLWVTVNGERVPSSKLYLNDNNELSILTEITNLDEVIITSMVPYATPNQETMLITVNKDGEITVYG